MRASVVFALSLLTTSVVAQGITTAKERFRNAGRALQNTNAEVERLIDLRLRHDLGLIDELDDSVVSVDNPATSTDMAGQRRELSKLTQETAYFRGEYEKLLAKVKLLNEVSAAAAENENRGEMIPTMGSTLPRSPRIPTPAPTQPIFTPQPDRMPTTMPAAPGVETAPSKLTSADLGRLALDPLKAQIHGSKDHLRVAQSLLKVGQALVDRANELRGQGRIEAAEKLDFRAKSRLERSIKELEPLLAEQDPPFVVLFSLGRCRELLFRFSERYEGLSLAETPTEYGRRRQLVREPFLQISARDVKKLGGTEALEVLGSWGQAAKTAMEHFRWMNTNASYNASPRIEALTWPGENR